MKVIIEIILIWTIGGAAFYFGIESVQKYDVPYYEQKYRKRKANRIIATIFCASFTLTQMLCIFQMIELKQPYAFAALFFSAFLCIKSFNKYGKIQHIMKINATVSTVFAIFIFGYFIFLPGIVDIVDSLLSLNQDYFYPITLQPDKPAISVMIFEMSLVNCMVIGGTMTFFLVSAIIYFKKANAAKKICEKMNGELGQLIKRRVPQNAAAYIIYDNRIHFKVFGKEEAVFRFSDIQMDKLPGEYLFPFYDWFCNNMIADRNLYKYEAVTASYYTGGTPGYYQTTKAYDGYRTSYVSGDSGYEEKETIGWKITSLKHIEEKKVKKLKNW